MTSISVVVPTYRRAEELARCLEALSAQTRPADAVVVVTRADDAESQAVATAAGVDVDLRTVALPGMLAAMAVGMQACTTGIIAFTDDDASPRNDWIAGLVAHFEDPGVGGVGGRDLIPDVQGPLTSTVGTISSWGRMTGNHHLGMGGVRDVDVLKGVNMAFRREALALPVGLSGSGAQEHSEVAACLHAHKQGWRLVYDPELVVDHRPAPRSGADRRLTPDAVAVSNSSQNYVYGLLTMRPELLIRRTLYGLLLGDWGAPGIGRAAGALLTGDRDVLRRLLPSLRGQMRATWWILRGRRMTMRAAGEGRGAAL